MFLNLTEYLQVFKLLDLSVAFIYVEHFLLEEAPFVGFCVECSSSIFLFLDASLMYLFVGLSFSIEPLNVEKYFHSTDLALCHRAMACGVPSAQFALLSLPDLILTNFFKIRIARRDKKAFLSDQCKEIGANNRMGKTRDLFKKIRDNKRTFHAKIVS